MNVLTASKHCWSQRGITITLFSRQFEVIFLIFYCISEMCMKFRALSKKKHEYTSLIFPEIICAERRGYLNVWKVLLQNTNR